MATLVTDPGLLEELERAEPAIPTTQPLDPIPVTDPTLIAQLEETPPSLPELAGRKVARTGKIAAQRFFKVGPTKFFDFLDRVAGLISEKTGLEKGGAFTTIANLSRLEGDELVIPEDLGEKILAGVSEAATGDVPKFALAVAGGGPVLGFAGVSALEAAAAGEDKLKIIEEGLKGALLGGAFKGVERLTRPVRAGALTTLGAAEAAAEGATTEEIIESGATLGILGLAGRGGPVTARQAISNLRDITRPPTRPITAEPKPVTDPKLLERLEEAPAPRPPALFEPLPKFPEAKVKEVAVTRPSPVTDPALIRQIEAEPAVAREVQPKELPSKLDPVEPARLQQIKAELAGKPKKKGIPFMPKEYNAYEQSIGTPSIARIIHEAGGIKPRKKGTPGAIREEVIENVPRFLLRKEGVTPNEMVSRVKESGYPRIETESDLLQALRDESEAIRRPHVELEQIGGPIAELGIGVPITRESLFRWQVEWAKSRAKAERVQKEADIKAPRVTFQATQKDLGAAYFFGTPSNRIKRYGPVAESAIRDINFTETEQIRAMGRRNEADRKAISLIPGKDFGQHGEVFWDVFEGKPLKDILARTDISEGTKQAARFFRAKFDIDRGTIIMLQREWMRPSVEAKIETTLRKSRFERFGKRRTKAEMALLRQEVSRRADIELKQVFPDNWGIKDYLPHLFPGDYRVFVKAKGEKNLIGVAQSKWEAQAKVAEYHAENPLTKIDSYSVESRTFMNPDFLRISRPRRWKFINDLAKATELTKEEISQATRGILGTKEAKPKWWGSLRQRKGYVGYSKDLEWVLEVYNSGLVRWSTQTELNRRIQPIIRQIRNEGRPKLAEEIEMNLKILSGYKSTMSDVIDNTLANTPGLRVIHQPFALERWANRLKSLQVWAFLKLSPRFHFLNRFQITQTLWPITDSKTLYEGLSLYNRPEGRKLLDLYGIRFLAARGKLAESFTRGILSEKTLERAKWFAPETSNQEIAFVTMYLEGIKRGMTEQKAAQYGVLRGNIYSQFLALRTDMPRAFYRRISSGEPSPIKGAIFAFKRFPIKDLELGYDLIRSGSIVGPAKWMAGHILMGGTKAFISPFMWIPGAGYLTFKVYNGLKEQYGEEVARFIYYGWPSLLGMDFSYSVQLIDAPFGESIQEKIGNVALGPGGALLTSVLRSAADEKGIEPSPGTRAFRALIQRTPSLRWMDGVNKIWTENYDFRDPAGRLRYEGDIKDVLLQIGAFRSMRQAEQDLLITAFMDVRQERDSVLDKAVALTLQKMQTKEPISQEDVAEAIKLVNDWNAMFPEFPIGGSDLKTRAKSRAEVAIIPQQRRILRQGPRKILPEFIKER